MFSKISCMSKTRIRVVATVGGTGRGRPPLTISARHPKKKYIYIYISSSFFSFFLVPGTMFHNRGSIIAHYTYVIYIENYLVRLWIPAGALPLDPPVVGAALHWLHSLRLPLLFTIIFHHSDWAGYNPDKDYWQIFSCMLCEKLTFFKFIHCQILFSVISHQQIPSFHRQIC